MIGDGFVRIDIEPAEIPRAQKEIRLTEGRIRTATFRAINETLRWAQGRLRKEMAREAGVTQKRVKGRFWTTRATRRSLRGELRVGVMPLILEDSEIPKRQSRMLASGEWLSKPFLAQVRGEPEFFVRADRNPNQPAQNRWTAGRKRTPGTENLPIRRPWVNIRPSDAVLRAIEVRVPDELKTKMDRLLKFELEKAARQRSR